MRPWVRLQRQESWEEVHQELLAQAKCIFVIFGGALVVSVGGYEHFESGVLILIGLAALSTLSSTLAQHFSKTLPLVEPVEQEAS